MLLGVITNAQSPNLVVITLDGTRWQEIYKGADYSLLTDTRFVQDTALMLQQYWHEDENERRKKLMPFFWSVIASKGQLFGNRQFDNKVNVANLYKISYPGYNEMFSGKPDWLFIPNLAVRNPRSNIFQFLNKTAEYKGRVAAFCSWQLFPFILNEKENILQVNAGYEPLVEKDTTSKLINQVQEQVKEQTNTRHDMLTYECAANYMKHHHPKVLYIGWGETDEYAHQGRYDIYLQKLHQADVMLEELWYTIQTDSFYKNNTTIIITTDHGRGKKTENWNTHGFWIKGSGETWMAVMGPGIEPKGEMKEKQQVYLKQLAPTIADVLGVRYEASFRVSQPIEGLITKTTEARKTITTAERKMNTKPIRYSSLLTAPTVVK